MCGELNCPDIETLLRPAGPPSYSCALDDTQDKGLPKVRMLESEEKIQPLQFDPNLHCALAE